MKVESELLGYFGRWPGLDDLPDGEYYTVFRVRAGSIFHTEAMHCAGRIPVPSPESESLWIKKLRKFAEREARMVYRVTMRFREIETEMRVVQSGDDEG